MAKLKIEENTESEFVEIKPGIHQCVITDAVDAVSSKGNDMLTITTKVGQMPIKTWVVFTAKNSRNVVAFAEAMGIKAGVGSTVNIEAETLIGRRATVELGEGDRISDKTGKPYLEIKRWLPASSDSLLGDEIPF
jgi:hypothetical protein